MGWHRARWGGRGCILIRNDKRLAIPPPPTCVHYNVSQCALDTHDALTAVRLALCKPTDNGLPRADAWWNQSPNKVHTRALHAASLWKPAERVASGS